MEGRWPWPLVLRLPCPLLAGSLLLPEVDLPEQPQDIAMITQLSRADQSGLFTEKNPTTMVEVLRRVKGSWEGCLEKVDMHRP